MPDWYKNRPEPGLLDGFWLGAFFELCSTRNFGMSIGPIPFDSILKYAEYKQLDRGTAGLFLAVIRELDEIYLKHLQSEQKRKK